MSATTSAKSSPIREKNPNHVPVITCWNADTETKPLKLLIPKNTDKSHLRTQLLAKGVPENVIDKLVIGDASMPLFGPGSISQRTVKEMDDLYRDADGYVSFRLPLPASLRSEDASLQVPGASVHSDSPSPDKIATSNAQAPEKAKKLEEELHKAKEKHADFQQQCAEKEEAMQAAMAKMKDDLGRQLERALQSVQVAEQKTQEAMSKVESQRLELELAREQLSSNKKEKELQIEEMCAKLQQISSDYGLQTRANKEKDAQIKAQDSKMEDLKVQLLNASSKCASLSSSNKEKDSEVEALKAKSEELQQECRSLSRAEMEKNSEIKALKAHHRETSSQWSLLLSSNQEKAAEIEGLKAMLQEMSSQCASLTSSNEDKEKTIAVLTARVATSESDNAKLANELHVCKERSEDCSAEAAEKEKLVKLLQARLSQCQEAKSSEVTLFSNRAQKAEAELKALQTQRADLEADLHQLKEASAESKKEVSYMSAEHQRERSAFMQQLKDANSKAQSAESDLQACRHQSAQHARELQDCKRQCEKLKEELASAQAAAAAAAEDTLGDATDAEYVVVTGSSSR